jgi:pimeloyl-ACP methyl ester carboxylesterase
MPRIANCLRLRFTSLFLLLAIVTGPALAQNRQGMPPEKTIPIFGQTIHYWDVGSGPVLVLLHGLGSSKEDWLAVVGPLSKNHRLLIPDQIGFGQSDKPLVSYSVQTFVDFLDEFLRQMKVEKASLVGESLGGWVSALYITEISGTDRISVVDKLVLADAPGLKEQTPTIPDFNASLNSSRGMLKKLFYDSSWINDERLRQSFAHRLAANDGYTIQSFLNNPALASEFLDDKLTQIGVPTLVVWASKISSSLFRQGKSTRQEFPGRAWLHSISADISQRPKRLRSSYPRSWPFLTRPLLRASE